MIDTFPKLQKAKFQELQLPVVEDVTYLWVARIVLAKHRRPLNARELVNYGLEDGLFPAAGLSNTPQKSMQARLSMDILLNTDSQFVRTSKGKFFLKELLDKAINNDAAEQGPPLAVYIPSRRSPLPATEMVLSLHKDKYRKDLNFQGIARVRINNPLSFLSNATTTYLPRAVAETQNDYKQVVTYTIIQHQSKVLSFRRGLYNRAASFLRGAQCIGFGGHVAEEDHNLFSPSDMGVRENAAREIGEELMLPNGRPTIEPSELEYLGTLNDDSSDVGVRHVAIVLRYWVNDWSQWRSVSRGEASINRLKWLDTASEKINLVEFEYWSQLVVRSFFPSAMTMVPGFKILKKHAFTRQHILCVVGFIGSGKSATSRFLVENCGYSEINSGRVLAELLGLPPIPQTARNEFQVAAQAFIESSDGPNKLGYALAAEADQLASDRILIDGVRHPETLEALKRATTRPVAVLYVYTPPDVAFEMYRYREGYGESSTSLSEFISLYGAPVESKIRYLLSDADVITYNWLGIDEYSESMKKLAGTLYDT